MALLSPILRSMEGSGLSWWCPGCNEAHGITYGGTGWTWDGNRERPTFSPSVLIRSGHYVPNGGCWCGWNDEHPDDQTAFECGVCHCFIRDGQIEFLSDCTHELAGETVPIPPWPHGAGGEP